MEHLYFRYYSDKHRCTKTVRFQLSVGTLFHKQLAINPQQFLLLQLFFLPSREVCGMQSSL